MKILILPGEGYAVESHEAPIEGRRYILIDAEDYTLPQRKLWEALVDEWHKYGNHSGSLDIYRFRENVKLQYGEGFDRLRYANGNKLIEVKDQSEIPDHVMLDFSEGNRERVFGVVKSTTRYTKNQFKKMIDKTINAMLEDEMDTMNFSDLKEGISDERD